MKVRSPQDLHYPITVTGLLKNPNDAVERFAPLFTYFYKSTVSEGNEFGEEIQVERTFPTHFESETDGTFLEWSIREGDVITGPGVPIAEIEEPCRHEVQFGDMCANCGADMTEINYAKSTRDTERAKINSAHGSTSLKISEDLASRMEDEAKRRLLANKRLSLVVDLDQTIIHATVDPTVAEWQNDPNNPNYEALKNVEAFQLTDEGPGGKGCWYYIKLRPGLRDFLENISKFFECHIYTMGTRAYAQNIAKIVDPQRKIFGDRILSRDESGSLTTKTLHRLFPVDTKMVVIIDDRGDVWNWNSNLVKVTPYDFFVGIGDINSSFLPKRQELLTAKPVEVKHVTSEPAEQPAEKSAEKATGIGDGEPEENDEGKTADKAEEKAEETPTPSETNTETTDDADMPQISNALPIKPNSNISSLEQQLVAMGGGDNSRLLEEQTDKQGKVIAEQVEARPLLQMQKKLDQEDEEADKENTPEDREEGTPETKHRHLLHDDDSELEHLERNLRAVHRAFFEEYEKKAVGSQGGRVAELKGGKSPKKRSLDDLGAVPDIKDIMPKMKRQVLKGVSIVFSGIIPLGVNVQYADIALWAKSFGAHVSTKITKKTTHVIANKERKTAKVKQAARYPHINIVTSSWLLESISRWERMDEAPHIIEVSEEDQDPNRSIAFDELEDAVLSGDDEEVGITGDEAEEMTSAHDTDDEIEEPQETGVLPTAEELYDDDVVDFLGFDPRDLDSDEEDGEDGDEDGNASATESVHSNASARTTDSTGKPRKRKRGTDSIGASDAEDSDNSTTGANGSGPRRKKKFQRVSSLNNMVNAEHSSGLPSPETTGPEEDQGDEDSKAAPVQDCYDDEDDDGLEADLMAEFEKDSDWEDG